MAEKLFTISYEYHGQAGDMTYSADCMADAILMFRSDRKDELMRNCIVKAKIGKAKTQDMPRPPQFDFDI